MHIFKYSSYYRYSALIAISIYSQGTLIILSNHFAINYDLTYQVPLNFLKNSRYTITLYIYTLFDNRFTILNSVTLLLQYLKYSFEVYITYVQSFKGIHIPMICIYQVT